MYSVDEFPSDVFTTAHYASTWWEKTLRAAQLGPRYYCYDVPRYWMQRVALGLPPIDLNVLTMPLGEFRPRAYIDQPLPPRLRETLNLLREAGVTIGMPPLRLLALSAAWWTTRELSGDMIECGAAAGATSFFLATLSRLNDIPRRIYLLDTFEGMPEPSVYDSVRTQGEYSSPANHVDRIYSLAEQLGIADQVVVCKGLFSETFAKWPDSASVFSFAHIDANIFQGTLEACEFCLPRMAPGGVVVFDDYNGLCDLGARLAIDRALQPIGLQPEPLAHCSAWLQMPSDLRAAPPKHALAAKEF